jgi:hypothetical protein
MKFHTNTREKNINEKINENMINSEKNNNASDATSEIEKVDQVCSDLIILMKM